MIGVFAIGYQRYLQLTLPLIQSIRKQEPGLQIVVVDNGSDPHYPEHKGVKTVRSDGHSVGRAFNVGARACGDVTWYLYMNNDCLIVNPFQNIVYHQKPGVIYGPCLYTHPDEDNVTYAADGWLLFHRDVWEAVGPMDEGYTPAAYEDIDWCYRARGVGVTVEKLSLPILHLANRTRDLWDWDGRRKVNRIRFMEKFGIGMEVCPKCEGQHTAPKGVGTGGCDKCGGEGVI